MGAQQQQQKPRESWAEKKKREAAERRERLRALEKYLANPNVRKRLEEKIPGGTITFQMLLASALLSCTKVRALLNCTHESIFLALLDAAELGLTVHWGPRGEAALVPFGDRCTLIIGYRGYAKLLYRTGIVRDVQMDVVCERDVWALRRTHQGVEFDHRQGFTGRGRMIGTYAVAYFRPDYSEGGGCVIATLELEKIEKIKAQVLGRLQADPKDWKNGKSLEQKIKEHPWTVWEREMAEKSAVRQLPKLFPTVDAMGRDIVGRAVEIDTKHERERGEHGEAPPATAAERAVPRHALPPDTALNFEIPEAEDNDFAMADLEEEEPPPAEEPAAPPAPPGKTSTVAVPRTESGRAATWTPPPSDGGAAAEPGAPAPRPTLAEVFADAGDDPERAAIQAESQPSIPQRGTAEFAEWLIEQFAQATDKKRLGQLSHDFGPGDYPPEYKERVGAAYMAARTELNRRGGA